MWAIFVYEAPDDLTGLSAFKLNRSIDELKRISQSVVPDTTVLVHGKPYVSANVAHTHLLELSGIATFIIIFLGGLIRKWSPSNRFLLLVLFSIISSYICGFFGVIVWFGSISLWALVCSSALIGLVVMLVGYFLLVQRHYPHLSPIKVFVKILPPYLGSFLLMQRLWHFCILRRSLPFGKSPYLCAAAF